MQLSILSGLRYPVHAIPILANRTFIHTFKMTIQQSSAQICADLHNAIVQHLTRPERGTRKDHVSILQTQHPALYSTLQGSQLLEFLSLIDNYDGTNNMNCLTPHVRKPDPSFFLLYRAFEVGDEYPEHILLYPDANSTNN